MFQSYNEPSYAGFWIRVLAYLIDTLLLSIVFCPLGFGLGLVGVAAEVDENSPAWMGINLLINGVSLLVGWLYFGLTESSSWQATVGKKLLKLKVTDMYGQRISFGRATGRYFGQILSGMICFIGYIMVAFTEKKQGLHDMLAGTLVVWDVPPLYEPPPPPDFSYRGQNSGPNVSSP
jgi:uncharacterized RDD family membrane protein YckC